MICLVMMVAFFVASVTDQAGAVLSHEDFLPRQQAGEASSHQAIVYSVEEGDSLWAISQKFDCDMDALMVLNDLNRNSILKIGREISIPGSGNNIHLIKAGETLWDIAASAGISVEELKKYNPGQDPKTLRIGDILKLPGGTRMVASQSSRGVKYADFILNWPLVGTITSYFGWRSQGFHYGLDIAAESGKNIRAAAAGVVTYAGWKGNYGKAVMIQHEDGRETLYGHMQRVTVKSGQKVNRGQVIGLVGSTGHSTGPHVHFEVRKNGVCYNPMNYLR